MNGEWALTICLATWGSLYLKSNGLDKRKIASSSAFQFISSLTFLRTYKESGQVFVADSAMEWFDALRQTKVSRLRMIDNGQRNTQAPDHQLVAFANGAPLSIVSDSVVRPEIWESSWNTGGPKDKPWIVEYRGREIDHGQVPPTINAPAMKGELRNAVSAAIAFAKSEPLFLGGWVEFFEKGITSLDSEDPKTSIPGILPEEGIDLANRQLIAAASQVWVFGGMGSWNDISFSDKATEREYQNVSASLFSAIKQALIVGVNGITAETEG